MQPGGVGSRSGWRTPMPEVSSRLRIAAGPLVREAVCGHLGTVAASGLNARTAQAPAGRSNSAQFADVGARASRTDPLGASRARNTFAWHPARERGVCGTGGAPPNSRATPAGRRRVGGRMAGSRHPIPAGARCGVRGHRRNPCRHSQIPSEGKRTARMPDRGRCWRAGLARGFRELSCRACYGRLDHGGHKGPRRTPSRGPLRCAEGRGGARHPERQFRGRKPPGFSRLSRPTSGARARDSLFAFRKKASKLVAAVPSSPRCLARESAPHRRCQPRGALHGPGDPPESPELRISRRAPRQRASDPTGPRSLRCMRAGAVLEPRSRPALPGQAQPVDS